MSVAAGGDDEAAAAAVDVVRVENDGVDDRQADTRDALGC
jgi:hypothetical protein